MKASVRYGPLYTDSQAKSDSRNGRRWLFAISLAIPTVLYAASYLWQVPLRSHNTNVGATPRVAGHRFPVPDASRRAVMTSLYDDDYAISVRVLGQSLRAAQVQARHVVMYIPGQVSAQVLCELETDGWELKPVERIAPPRAGVNGRFEDQFTKLQIWNMTEFDAIYYVDGDCLAVQNFDEIWQLPSDFAAVPDVWFDSRGFILDINAGAFLARPSTAEYNRLCESMYSANFDIFMAEQNLLSVVYRYDVLRLPYIYSANLAIKHRDVSLWRKLLPSIRIIHFTMDKPHWRAMDAQAGKLYEEEFALWHQHKLALDLVTSDAKCRATTSL